MDFFRFLYYPLKDPNPRCRPRPILRHLRPNSPPLPRLRRNHYLAVRQFLRINSQKRPVSEAGTINPSNHSMNSLCSDSISYFVAQIVFANQRLNVDSENPTYSKDLLVRNVFENSIRGNMEHRAVTSSARFACRRMFSRIYSRKHEAPVRKSREHHTSRQPIKKHGEPRRGKGSRAIPKP